MSATKAHTILIVDDEPDVLFSLTGLLRRDFNVHTAKSGAEALEILRENCVHVVMTDQRMPSMTGVELMQRVRNEHPEAIRIVFTGYADTRAIVDAINKGELYRYITKPWDPDDLIEVLRRAARKHDAMAAQAEILSGLGGYLDEVERLIASMDANQIDAESLASWQTRTHELRRRLDCIGDVE